MQSPIIRQLRRHLKLTQAGLGRELGVTQVNVSFYERGQALPPRVAEKLIECARARGVEVDFNHIYGKTRHPDLEQAA